MGNNKIILSNLFIFNMMYNIIINKKIKIKYVYTLLSWVMINIFILFNIMYLLSYFLKKKCSNFPLYRIVYTLSNDVYTILY